MNKVLQAAGRVIRTADDVGIVALLDDRFLTPGYRRLFPREWSSLSRPGREHRQPGGEVLERLVIGLCVYPSGTQPRDFPAVGRQQLFWILRVRIPGRFGGFWG